jgi:hypothetical protein
VHFHLKDRAILATMARLKGHNFTGIQPLAKRDDKGGCPVRIEEGRELPNQLFPAIPQAFASLPVYVNNAATDGLQKETVGGMVNKGAEPGFAGAQFTFDSFPFRNVLNQ